MIPIHFLLPLALSFQFPYLCSRFLHPCQAFSPAFPVVQRGVGYGFQVSIVILCADVISIDGVQLGQAVLAQGLFTVYPKLKPFTVRFVLVCAFVWVCVCVFVCDITFHTV